MNGLDWMIIGCVRAKRVMKIWNWCVCVCCYRVDVNECMFTGRWIVLSSVLCLCVACVCCYCMYDEPAAGEKFLSISGYKGERGVGYRQMKAADRPVRPPQSNGPSQFAPQSIRRAK